jgi:hypothetical protein
MLYLATCEDTPNDIRALIEISDVTQSFGGQPSLGLELNCCTSRDRVALLGA